MSETRVYGAIRFRIKPEFKTWNDVYNSLLQYLGDAKKVDYVHVWKDGEFKPTADIEYVSWAERNQTDVFNVEYSYDTKEFFLDYVLVDKESDGDLGVTVTEELLNKVVSRAKEFSLLVSAEYRIKVYEHYTGTDFPVEW